MYNNTCILLNSDGEIILSDPHLHGHNAAIKNCAEKIGIELDDTQPMPKMLEKLARVNIFSLLNARYVVDEDGNKRKTGYMAVPSKFKNTQLDGLKILVSGFDQYKTIYKVFLCINDFFIISNFSFIC